MDNRTDTANEKTEQWFMTFQYFSANGGMKGLADCYVSGPITKERLEKLEAELIAQSGLKGCKVFLVNSLKLDE